MDITTIIIYIAAAALIIFGIYYTVQKFRGKAKSSCCGTPEVKAVRKVDTEEKILKRLSLEHPIKLRDSAKKTRYQQQIVLKLAYKSFSTSKIRGG